MGLHDKISETFFTNEQASACRISRMEKSGEGDLTAWVVGVLDVDGNYYDMILNGLGASPGKSNIKSVVIAELLNREKEPLVVVNADGDRVEPEEVTDKGLGETLG